MKKIMILSAFFLLLQSCNKENKQNKENNIFQETELKKMENILEKQLREGASQYALDENGNSISETLKHKITMEELDASTIAISEILKSNGYKTLSNIDFNNKINRIFGRLIDNNSLKKYLYLNYYNKCDKEFSYQPNDVVNFYGTYIIKNKNFITDFYFLPELIDYQEKFKNIAQKEKAYPNKWYNNELKMELGVEKWMELEVRKDEFNLSKKRNLNKMLIINRNKYLFNDNKVSLVWLKFNDQQFLESLVKTFGYVQDKDLLKWVLNRNLNEDEFDKLLFTKTCDQKYVFHKEIFEVIEQLDPKSKDIYISFLKEHFPKIDGNNFSEETKIHALYCYYSTKLFDNTDYNFFSFFPRMNEEKFEEEFKKNNYYNLSDFKDLYKKTRYGALSPAE